MIKGLTPLILNILLLFNMKKKKNEKFVLFKTPFMKPLLSRFTPQNVLSLWSDPRIAPMRRLKVHLVTHWIYAIFVNAHILKMEPQAPL